MRRWPLFFSWTDKKTWGGKRGRARRRPQGRNLAPSLINTCAAAGRPTTLSAPIAHAVDRLTPGPTSQGQNGVRAGSAGPCAPCPRGEGERACEAVARKSWPVSLSLFLSHSTLSLPASSSPARPSCTHRRIKVVMAMVTGVAGGDEKSVRVCGRKEGGGHGQQKAEPVFCARRAMPCGVPQAQPQHAASLGCPARGRARPRLT